MATPSVSKAAAQLVPNFRPGGKKIYLPNHVITFIRPKPKQPPNLATFVVPLTFTKLDMRDYLFHAYNVEVTAMRSFINEKKPVRKDTTGPWYRPRSQKMMIAELVKPFVWPEPPVKTAEARSAFDYELHLKTEAERKKQYQDIHDFQTGLKTPLRTELKLPKAMKQMRAEAREIMSKPAEWTGKALLDEGEGKWVEVDADTELETSATSSSMGKARRGGARKTTESKEAAAVGEAQPELSSKEYNIVVEDSKEPPKKTDGQQ
ncbi:hypothetical protein B0H66DRAFT_240697 [Apodospora peruviana]|uniref:Large ribosomal subunit protein uL23m n=1 Tax=Apodospora peruviana TaxID=516989 RepID=A0AAE0I6H2_9PEZI|nr:hypothetical protein B0H66DRAFT_240697 [Apodospora peruviana]